MFCGIVWPVFHGRYARVGLSDLETKRLFPLRMLLNERGERIEPVDPTYFLKHPFDDD